MPFTPSHVAAALPFARTPLVPAALAIGTMGPDLVYFVPLPIHRTFTHDLAGVFSIDLVLGVALFLLWQVVLRRPLVDFTPLPVRSRVATLPPDGLGRAGTPWWGMALLVLASVLIGGVTHVAWDSFTHAGAVVDALPGLAMQLRHHPVYKWLQWASSLFGFLAVVGWALLWLRKTPPIEPPASRLSTPLRWTGWISVVFVGLAASVPVWVLGARSGLSLLDNQLVFRTVTIGIAAAGAATLLWALAWHLLRERAPLTRNG